MLFSAIWGVLIFVGIWTAGSILWLRADAVQWMNQEADQQIRELSASLAPLVWNLDDQSIQTVLDTKMVNHEFVSIVVTNSWGGHQWAGHGSRAPSTKSDSIQRKADILFGSRPIGSVEIDLSLKPQLRRASNAVVTLFLSELFLFLAVISGVIVSWNRVVFRLQSMVKTMQAFTPSQGDQRMSVAPHDELGVLAQGFNAMADSIQETTRSMEQRIQQGTERLMESEKMALVGSLVAGVAHEINTPVGNGVTISSWLAQRVEEIRSLSPQEVFQGNTWKGFVDDVESSVKILISGLNRTSDLIQTFKKIGAEQVVDDRRPLFIQSFLAEVCTSLQPTLKAFPHVLTIDCPRDFSIENHPGALFQIVTNLILNAHGHAFQADEEGSIVVKASLDPLRPDSFCIEVIDDGCGIPPESQEQIFQPFYTTNRLQGGTGLGLAIALSLANRLGGTIDLVSTVGEGSRFFVRLPLIAPDTARH